MIRFFLFLSILCMAACSKKQIPVAKQIVRISIQSEPACLDPRKARSLESLVVLKMLFEGLMRVSKDGQLEPGIADNVEISDDRLRYVFHLRKTDWSNGTPLTASDFLFAWKSVLDPKFATDIAYHFYPIKNAKKAKLGEVAIDSIGIYAIDSQTLVVELEEPTPYFLDLLATPPFFPVCESIAVDQPLWSLESSTWVSNGPFQIALWNHADQLNCEKNSFYWDKDFVSLDEIHLSIASSDTGLRMFEEKKIDWMGSPLSTIPTDAITPLKASHQLESAPFLATSFCRLNTEDKIGDKENPLSNVLFRKALALSLDRSSIVDHLLKGGQTIATRLVPLEMGLSKDSYFSDRDFQKAKELLTQIQTETPFAPIVISYFNNERNALIAQTLQKQWQDHLAISVEIEAVEPKVYFQRIARKEFQIAIGSWTADFNDPINFLEVFKYKDNGTNNTGWENPKYIDLLNRSALCKDLEERKSLLQKAEEILMDEMPLIPIYHFALNYVKNDALTGVYLSPQGYLELRNARWQNQVK
jgi:oligopeptide transport system substrate-binding protein